MKKDDHKPITREVFTAIGYVDYNAESNKT